MGRSPGVGVVPGPYMTMSGQMVPGPPPLPYQVSKFMLLYVSMYVKKRKNGIPLFHLRYPLVS